MKEKTDYTEVSRTVEGITRLCELAVEAHEKKKTEEQNKSKTDYGQMPPGKEFDPTGTKAGEPGAKLDGNKVLAGVLSDFSLALMAVAEVGTHGANKYSRGGWQHVPNWQERYRDADWRHLLKSRHEEYDVDSGLLHDAHRAWNVLAALELKLREKA